MSTHPFNVQKEDRKTIVNHVDVRSILSRVGIRHSNESSSKLGSNLEGLQIQHNDFGISVS